MQGAYKILLILTSIIALTLVCVRIALNLNYLTDSDNLVLAIGALVGVAWITNLCVIFIAIRHIVMHSAIDSNAKVKWIIGVLVFQFIAGWRYYFSIMKKENREPK